MKFAYQRGGAPLLSWRNGPPIQSRAADSVALGSTLSEPIFGMPLPKPGAPEPLSGCGCGGGGGGGSVLDLNLLSIGVGIAIGYFLIRRNTP
jgi:hypothetical protein